MIVHLSYFCRKPLSSGDWTNLDYNNIIFDKPNNESFKSRIKSVQYKACVAMTGAIESSSDRCWFQKLMFFYKIV